MGFNPDHDERIPLFTKTIEAEPDLPYGPLLRYMHFSNSECFRIADIFYSKSLGDSG